MFTFSQMADVKNYRNKAKVKDLYIYIFFQLVTFENRPPRVCFFFVFPPQRSSPCVSPAGSGPKTADASAEDSP